MCRPHCVLNKASCSAMMNYERRDNSLVQPTKESKLADAGSVSPSRHNTGKSHKAIEENQGPPLSNTQTLLILVRSFLMGHLPAENLKEIGFTLCASRSDYRRYSLAVRAATCHYSEQSQQQHSHSKPQQDFPIPTATVHTGLNYQCERSRRLHAH